MAVCRKNDLEITNHMIDQAVYFMEEISQYPQSSLIQFCKHSDQTQKWVSERRSHCLENYLHCEYFNLI